MRYAVAVAETRHFTRAAQRCHVVQSALSQQVARLERELGVQLFARSSRRVEVTPAGEAFVARARECLAAAERAGVDAAAAAGQVRGRVRMGLIPTATAVDVPDLLRRVRAAHPLVRVALQAGSSDELTRRVADGRLDVALLGLPLDDRPGGVASRELGRDRHVLVTAPGHRLAGAAVVALDELADEPFADFPADTPGRVQTDRAFAALGVARDVAFEVMDAHLLLDLVRAGLGVALLPARVVAGAPGVTRVPVRDGPGRAEHVVWSEFNPAPATRALLAELDGARRPSAG